MTLETQDGFVRPPDCPAYVAQPRTLATGGAATLIGDGVGTRGSPMPVLSIQLDDIPSTATGWLLQSTPPPETDAEHIEAKFRAHANVSHILPDDPIRNYGQPGTSHLHTFFGNAVTNAFTTFASSRNRANERAAKGQVASTTSGGPYNASNYWVPAVMNGGQVVKMGIVFIYYTANPAARSLKGQRLPRGLRYVAGFNMDDPDDLEVKAIIAAANAVEGWSRYAYISNGFAGWQQVTAIDGTGIPTREGNTYSPCIVNLDGSDPWDGAAGAGCFLKPFVNAPAGIDGHNLWSPGGYKHTTQPIQDNSTGLPVIWQGWNWVPELQIVPFYRHNGWDDYKNWYLSSDAHASMVAGRTLAPGTSFHADWIGAWDDSVFGADTGWQIQCIGVKDRAVMHECGSGTFDAAGHRLLGSFAGDNAPDGSRTPQISFPEIYDTDNPEDMFSVPAGGFSGPVTVPARIP